MSQRAFAPRKKRSILWQIPRDDLIRLVNESRSHGEVLAKLGLRNEGGRTRILRQRLQAEEIVTDHLPVGRNHNRGKSWRRPRRPLEEMLVEDAVVSRGNVKRRLIQEGILKEQCQICGLGPLWREQKLVLEIDHINGKRHDYRQSNLRLLCPNCHSQMPTCSGRNKPFRDSSAVEHRALDTVSEVRIFVSEPHSKEKTNDKEVMEYQRCTSSRTTLYR